MMRTGVAKLVTPFPIYIILIASRYLRKLMLCPSVVQSYFGGFKTFRSTSRSTIRLEMPIERKAVTRVPRLIAGRQSGELLLQLYDLPLELCGVEVRMDLHQFLLIGQR
jgi:hypothetical protein